MGSSLRSRIAAGVIWRADRAVRPLADRWYRLARLYTRATLALSRWERPVLVYTMGKVGSSSLAHSLRVAAPELDVLHVHRLVPEHLARAEHVYREAARRHRGTPAGRGIRPRHVWLAQRLSSLIERPPPGADGRWTVITLIRDPVARNTSAFFENLFLFFGYDWAQALRLKPETAVAAELGELFRASYARERWWSEGKDANPLTWFDEELRETFGVDVFDEPFPTEVGFKIYERERARVLLVRLEDLDRCASVAMQELLGPSGFEVHRRNVAHDKGYASLYRRFSEVVELPADYVDRLYDSRIARHFYTERERAAFRSRALRGHGGGASS